MKRKILYPIAIILNYPQIKLYNDKAQITFNTPTLQSPDNKGSFLTFKNKMKKIIQNKPQPIYIDMTVEFYV